MEFSQLLIDVFYTYFKLNLRASDQTSTKDLRSWKLTFKAYIVSTLQLKLRGPVQKCLMNDSLEDDLHGILPQKLKKDPNLSGKNLGNN